MSVAKQKAIDQAAKSLSDLNTFDILISIIENGHLHSPSYAAGERIIKICKAEISKRLRDYDKHAARALDL